MDGGRKEDIGIEQLLYCHSKFSNGHVMKSQGYLDYALAVQGQKYIDNKRSQIVVDQLPGEMRPINQRTSLTSSNVLVQILRLMFRATPMTFPVVGRFKPQYRRRST
jgi:hypothetical protein